MKILVLLFSVVFLVFQTQSEATAVVKNEAPAKAVALEEAKAEDEVLTEDAAAAMSSPELMQQRSIIHCERQLGVCRTKCTWREKTIGWCSRFFACCKRRF